MPSESITSLQKTFLAFANYGKGTRDMLYDMDIKAFAKLTRECGLVTKQCTPTDVDLCFTKGKDKKDRRINYQQFEKILEMIAEKKGKSKAWVFEKVANSEGPLSYATKSEAVRFHDDKTTYTGVWRRGGPSTHDGKQDLSALLDRSPSDIRGRGGDFRKAPRKHQAPSSYYMVHEQKLASAHWRKIGNAIKATGIMKGLAGNSAAKRASEKTKQVAGQDVTCGDEEEESPLKKAFLQFASYGKGAQGAEFMTGSNFRKALKDCDLVPTDMTDAEIDLIFTAQRFQGWRAITFQQFQEALKVLADKTGLGYEKACNMVIYAGGPISYATAAEEVPFHDDKTMYTGSWKYGDILSMKREEEKKRAEAEAAAAAAEEAKKGPRMRTASELERANSAKELQIPSGPRIRPKLPYEAPLPIIRPGTSPQTLPGDKVKNPRLYAAFLAFANHGRSGSLSQKNEIDGKCFKKLVQDSKLMGRDLQPHEVDLIFTRVKDKKQRVIDYEAFQEGLSIIAQKKGQTLDTVMNKVAQSRPVQSNVTRSIPVQEYMRPVTAK